VSDTFLHFGQFQINIDCQTGRPHFRIDARALRWVWGLRNKLQKHAGAALLVRGQVLNQRGFDALAGRLQVFNLCSLGEPAT
jgi:hypothetical protein